MFPYSKGKKPNFVPCFSKVFAAAMPLLHVPEEPKVSRVQLHLLSLQAAASTSLCAGSGSGASWAPPSSPAQCRAPTGLAWSSSWKAARQEQQLAHGCVFRQSLGLCLASAAGWASSTLREWGWGKLFLRSPLPCSSSFVTSPRARSLLSEKPLLFLMLLPIQWLSSYLVLLSHG